MDSSHEPFDEGCTVCGDEAVYSRGLCQKHYRQFKKQLDSFENDELAEAYEERLLDEGWIQPKQKGGRTKSWSPFEELAQQIRRASEIETSDPLDDPLNDPEVERQLKKAATKAKATESSKSTKKKKTG